MMRKSAGLLLVMLVITVGCGEDKPLAPDGNSAINIAIVDTSGFFPGSVSGEPMLVPGVSVSIQARTQEYVDAMQSEDGVADFSELPAGEYSIFARKKNVIIEIPDVGFQTVVFSGFADVRVEGPETLSDTLYVSWTKANGLLINEIFYAGSNRSSFYFYDQFVELYNSSEDTLYLDGCIITRNYPTVLGDLEEIDFARAIHAFQFPGTPLTGKQYPIYPGQYVVIAADAIDHSLYSTGSVDLSGSDWEMFNPLGSDYDVLDVPNLVNIMPDKTIDYMINLSHNAVVLATGEEYGFETYDDDKLRLTLPLYTIIDGVEYASSSDKTKELTMRVDAGFAGIGCTKYSGQSTERREIGIDANNSTFDFILISAPTPGYSHVQ
jgi:hypothetical protein